MTCAACEETFLKEKIWPDCTEARCPVGFDELEPEDIRLMEVRGMLGLLSEFGLAARVCKKFQVTDEDLEQLALLEMECRRLAKETAGGGQGDGGS